MASPSDSSSSKSWTNPSNLLMLAQLGSGLFGGIENSRTNAKTLAQQQQLAEAQMANQKAISAANNAAGAASTEEGLDPFRQQIDQAKDIASLDRMENASYTPVTLAADPRYAAAVPKMSGGFHYTKSPDVTSSAAALKRNIMGGNVAPSMTDPHNYGKTAALDLVGLTRDGVDPATVSARGGPAGARPSIDDQNDPGATSYMRDYTQLGGGTVGSPAAASAKPGALAQAAGLASSGAGIGGAIGMIGGPVGAGIGAGIGAGAGALVGGVASLMNKHAASRASDYSVNDAKAMLDTAIRDQLGRPPNPGEIDQLLAGQGLKPGDSRVGTGGLTSVLNTIVAQGQQRATGGLPVSYTGRG